MTPCLTCGRPCRGPRCPAHQRAHKAKYGPTHQAERQAWAPLVAEGRVICSRCQLPINPGAAWDLGHRPGLPSHPEHARCNRAAH